MGLIKRNTRVAKMTQTLSQVKDLEKFIQKHGEDSFISQTISKMLSFKIRKYAKDIKRLDEEIIHKMKSAAFFKAFQEGKIGDDLDFIEWSSIYKMQKQLIEKEAELEGIK